jgi:hypothetical protein
MGAPSPDPGLEALIALLHGDAEGRVCGASAFKVDHAERRRADVRLSPRIRSQIVAMFRFQ